MGAMLERELDPNGSKIRGTEDDQGNPVREPEVRKRTNRIRRGGR